jgi:hypothetical protein
MREGAHFSYRDQVNRSSVATKHIDERGGDTQSSNCALFSRNPGDWGGSKANSIYKWILHFNSSYFRSCIGIGVAQPADYIDSQVADAVR